MCYVETDNVYRDMSQNLHLYDTSNYPSDSPLFSNDRKKKVGIMKDEPYLYFGSAIMFFVCCLAHLDSTVGFLLLQCTSCSATRGSPGVGRNTFLSSPHLCFIIVFICDLYVSRDDPVMS